MVSEKAFTGKNFRRMLVEKVTGEMVTAEHWRVPSTSTHGVKYDLHVEDRDGILFVACNCKSGRIKKPCKHGLWVVRQVYFDPRLLFAVIHRLEEAA